MVAEPPSFRAFVGARARLVGRAAVLGAASGVLLLVVLLGFGPPGFASRKSFAVGALAFGFGLVGWSGTVMAGTGFETMQEHLGVGSGWTEEDSRRAMVRVCSIGAGWMIGTSVASVLITG